MGSFNEVIKSGKPVLVDFYADWCGPCKMMAPILKETKDAFGEKITIIKVDVDRNRETAQHYSIQGIPTLILFQNGQIKWRESGVIPANDLKKLLSNYIS